MRFVSVSHFSMRVVIALLLSLSVFSVQASSLPDFTELVEEHAQVVVNISTVSKSPAQQTPQLQGDMQQIPDFLRHFFGSPYQDREEQKERQSTGSGFVVTEDGYILTNNHVVEGADEIFVRFNDRTELVAELVGSDKRSDLAVLKVDTDGLPTAKLGKSKDLKVGEWVFAIGSPFGFDYTVTAGIVSAKGRSLPNENYVPFIQTDVAINPGNSGGPLFNMRGEVVGINSQIYTRSGGFMGMSFAIPMDVAMEVVDQLRGQGYVSRGWLGVLIQEVSKELAESFGLDKPHGALVAQVVPESPAQDAGLKVGDVIVKYEDEKINLSSQLPHFVGRTKVGDEAKLTVIRDGERIKIEVEIGELPNSSDVPVKPTKNSAPEVNRLGIMVKELDDAAIKDAGLEGGVQVLQVKKGAASKAGIRQGDIIAKINNEDFESLDDFEDLVDDLPEGTAIPVLVIRGGNPSFLVLKIED